MREKGTGSIYYNEKRNRWVGVYQLGYDKNGNRKRKTVTAKTRREVKDKLAMLQAEVTTGIYKDSSRLTISDIARSINDNKYNLNIINNATYLRENETINKITITKPIQQVTELDLTTYFATITHYSNSVLRKVYATINRSYKKAIQLDLVSRNLLDAVPCPKSKVKTKKVTALTKTEQAVLVSALQGNSDPHSIMLLLSMYTGMRMGEICALSITDVNFNFKTINISKTITRDANDRYVIGTTTKTYAGTRVIQMSDTVYSLLHAYKPAENALNLFFSRPQGNFTTSMLNSYFRRILAKCDLPQYNQHILRHTYATRCIESGMPAKVLQHILGHADITTTLNTYCDVFGDYEGSYVSTAEQYLKDSGLA